jgi:hypothetical protein
LCQDKKVCGVWGKAPHLKKFIAIELNMF